jgi:lipopolysaccharide transport system ATP-binding protein
VDEALAVGDAKFQAKCFECLKQLKKRGTSILLVTHSSEQIVTHCSRAMLLNAGSVLVAGEPRHVVNCYMDLLFGKERKEFFLQSPSVSPGSPASAEIDRSLLNHVDDVFATRNGYNPHEYRWGDGSATILDFYLAADNAPYPSIITTGQIITLGVAIRFHADLEHPILGITIKTKEGVTVYGANSRTLETAALNSLGKKGTAVIADAVFTCRLAPGDYFVSLGIATKEGEEVIPHDRRYDAIHLQVGPVTSFFGLCNLEIELTVKEIAP